MTFAKILPLFFTLSFISSLLPLSGQDIRGGEYFIRGQVKGIKSGTVRMLSTDGKILIDSTLIAEGTFCMKGKIDEPARLLFNIYPGNWNFRAFVDGATIKLLVDTAGAQYQTNGTEKWALIWEIKETGSPFADIYEQYNNSTNQKYCVSVIASLREKSKAAKDLPQTSASTDLALDSLRRVLLSKQRGWIENYIKHNPSSIAGLYIFNEYFQNFRYYEPSPRVVLSYLDSTLNKFSGVAVTSTYYRELVQVATNLRSIQPEAVTADFTLQQRDKSEFTLSSTRGRYTLIDFWASWCLPCRKAIPEWKQLYAKYKDKGFVIVGVSSDRSWDDWIRALNKEKMSWTQVKDKFPDESKAAMVTESFGVNSLPFYVLLDKAGKVIVSSNDKKLVMQKIEEVFGQ